MSINGNHRYCLMCDSTHSGECESATHKMWKACTESMKSELEELRKDKLRLEWMIYNSYRITENIENGTWSYTNDQGVWNGQEDFDSPRSAIDAAMERSK